jgi:hypothetical protein
MGGRSRGPSGPSPEEVAATREREARLAQQQEQLTAQESELASRTSASLRARRRGGGRAMLLGTDEDQSTLG